MDVVSDVGDDEFYRTARYQIPLVVVLINSSDKSIFNIIDDNIRQTDIIQQLSADLIVVFLTHTDYEASLLCMEKIKKIVDFTYTLDEYKGLKPTFIKNLFIENMKMLGVYDGE